jgi:hypothetical protein
MNKEAFLQDLATNGKNDRSWEKLAKEYGFSNGEYARTVWKRYRKTAKIAVSQQVNNYISDLEDRVISLEEDVEKGRAELVYRSKVEIRTLEELIEKTEIDLNKWKITRWRQNYWGNVDHPHWQVRVELEPRKLEEVATDEFKEFLKSYQPHPIITPKVAFYKDKALLIINKQDAHYNKFDELGDNDLKNRFQVFEEGLLRITGKASLFSDLSIKYIIGSDEFNSEWTNTTTKGTPQTNLLPFHKGFEAICNHEVKIVEGLLQSAIDVEVIYIPGNHDEYVGWHLVSWLKAYFRNQPNLTFDLSPIPTKYFRYGNSAIMFNHGNGMKPEKMAQIFPVEFRSEWSKCEYFYIFAGDRHTEKNADFSGIKFYGLPAFSTAKSSWDLKLGLVGTKSEITAFLIQEDSGISDIYKEPVK